MKIQNNHEPHSSQAIMSQALHCYIAHRQLTPVCSSPFIHNASDNCNYITSEEWPLYPTEDRPGTKVIHCGDVLLRHRKIGARVHPCGAINVKYTDYFNRILNWDFRVDFQILEWISGFHSGFLDFRLDFWISV